MRYQAVLFDFDGTLFDTEHDEMTALSALVTQATGVEPPKDKLLKTFGMTGPVFTLGLCNFKLLLSLFKLPFAFIFKLRNILYRIVYTLNVS